MTNTPGYEVLEELCLDMTFGGELMEAGPDDLLARSAIEGREAGRLMRVAIKTPITKQRKRQGRIAKAVSAKVRQVYLAQISAVVSAGTDVDELGDLSIAAVWIVRQHAIAFGRNWAGRQVAW